jgi:replicative DNA helicase
LNNLKIPPQNIEIEQSVLSGCLQYPDFLEDAVDSILPEHFYKTPHQKLFSTIIQQYRQKNPVDSASLFTALKENKLLGEVGGATYLAQLLDIPIPSNMEYACEKLREVATLRKTIEICNKTIIACFENQNPKEVIDTIQKEILSVDDFSVDNFVTMKELTPQSIDRYENANKGNGDYKLKTGFYEFDTLIGGLSGSKLIIIAGRPRMGKCLGKGTKVVMSSGGVKCVEGIIDGDLLMGADSKPKKVLSVTTGKEMMYWIRQNKGIDYRVNGSHILSLKRSKNEGNKKHGEINNLSVDDILNNKSRTFLRRWKGYKVGIDFPEKKVSLEPYFVGLWLGDGLSAGSKIFNTDIEVINYLEEYAKRRTEQIIIGDKNRSCKSYNITNGLRNKGGVPGEANCNAKLTNRDVFAIETVLEMGMKQKEIARLYNVSPAIISNINTGRRRTIKKDQKAIYRELKDLGLLNNKHIPEIYLINSRRKRMELLAGLIDSDGHLLKVGCYEITMINQLLMEQIKYLCDSLGLGTGKGIKEKIVKNQNGFRGTAYKLIINGNLKDCPIKIKRKIQKNCNFHFDRTMTGLRIERDKVDDYYGFTLTGDGLFLLEDMTATHNTAIMLNVAQYMAQRGDMVGIFEIEMDKEDLDDRLMSNFTGINTIKLQSGKYLGATDWQKITEAAGKKYDLPIIIDDTGGLKIQELKRRSRKMKKMGCKIIFIDQLSKIIGNRKKSKFEEVSEIVEEISHLKKELRMPIVLLAQINRQAITRTGKRPMLEDLKNTGQLEEDADIVVLLHRPFVYTKDPNDEGHALFDVAKAKGAPEREINLYWDGKTTSFSNPPQDEHQNYHDS